MLDWEKLEKLFGQLVAVGNAPVPFLVALVILGGLIWWAIDWRFNGVLSHRDAEISRIKGERDGYKTQLNNSTTKPTKDNGEFAESDQTKKGAVAVQVETPEFMTNIRIGIERDPSDLFVARYQLVMRADISGSFQRLRILLDQSQHEIPLGGWMGPTRIPLEEFRDTYPGQSVRVVLANGGIASTAARDTRARITILDSSDAAQRYAFLILSRAVQQGENPDYNGVHIVTRDHFGAIDTWR